MQLYQGHHTSEVQTAPSWRFASCVRSQATEATQPSEGFARLAANVPSGSLVLPR
jgi:hypothetical protein